MVVVERIRYYSNGSSPSCSIVFIANDNVDLAHQAKVMLEKNKKNERIGFRVREISVPTSVDELIEDLKG